MSLTAQEPTARPLKGILKKPKVLEPASSVTNEDEDLGTPELVPSEPRDSSPPDSELVLTPPLGPYQQGPRRASGQAAHTLCDIDTDVLLLPGCAIPRDDLILGTFANLPRFFGLGWFLIGALLQGEWLAYLRQACVLPARILSSILFSPTGRRVTFHPRYKFIIFRDDKPSRYCCTKQSHSVRTRTGLVYRKSRESREYVAEVDFKPRPSLDGPRRELRPRRVWSPEEKEERLRQCHLKALRLAREVIELEEAEVRLDRERCKEVYRKVQVEVVTAATTAVTTRSTTSIHGKEAKARSAPRKWARALRTTFSIGADFSKRYYDAAMDPWLDRQIM